MMATVVERETLQSRQFQELTICVIVVRKHDPAHTQACELGTLVVGVDLAEEQVHGRETIFVIGIAHRAHMVQVYVEALEDSCPLQHDGRLLTFETALKAKLHAFDSSPILSLGCKFLPLDHRFKAAELEVAYSGLLVMETRKDLVA